MINNVSSNYKVNEVVKTSSNNRINNTEEKTENSNLSTEDKANFNTYKKASANESTDLFNEKKDFINPIVASLGFVLAFLSLAASSTYNEQLYKAFSTDLDKCKKFFDKYGMSGELDFLGNISSPQKKEEENTIK